MSLLFFWRNPSAIEPAKPPTATPWAEFVWARQIREADDRLEATSQKQALISDDDEALLLAFLR